MINKTLNLWLVPIFLAAVLRGAPVGPVSLSLLDKLATDIVVGSVVAPSSGTLTVDIRRAIKGGLVAGTLVSLSVPAPVSGSVQAKPSSDQPVIVFLQKNGSTYELLPSSLTVF